MLFSGLLSPLELLLEDIAVSLPVSEEATGEGPCTTLGLLITRLGMDISSVCWSFLRR